MSRRSSASTTASTNTGNSLQTATTRSNNSSKIYPLNPSSSSSTNTATSHCRIDDLLKRILSCQICHRLYDRPKLLPCLHSFCYPCLNSYVPDHSLSLACPSCRQHSILPVNGVDALKDNLFLLRLVSTVRRFSYEKGDTEELGLEENCQSNENIDLDRGRKNDEINSGGHKINPAGTDDDSNVNCTGDRENKIFNGVGEEIEGRINEKIGLTADNDAVNRPINDNAHISTNNLPTNTDVSICLQHENAKLSHFCIDCDTVICDICIKMEHREHGIKSLKEFADDEKMSLEKTVKRVTCHVKPLSLALRNIEKTQDKLLKQTLQAEQNIKEQFLSLVNSIELRKQNLLRELSKKSLMKKETLNDQKRNIESVKKVVELCKESIENCLTDGESPIDVVLAKKELQDSLEQFCLINFQLMPDENPFVTFDSGELKHLEACFKNFDILDVEDGEHIEIASRRVSISTPETASITVNNNSKANLTPGEDKISDPHKRELLLQQITQEESNNNARLLSTSSTASSVRNRVNSQDESFKIPEDETNDLKVQPNSLGVVISSSAVAHETKATGENLKRCRVNTPARVVVTTRDSKGQVVSNYGAKISAKICFLNASDSSVLSDSASTCSSRRERSVSADRNVKKVLDFLDDTPKKEQNEDATKHNAINKEDIVRLETIKTIKESRIRRNILTIPEIVRIDDFSYEISFMITDDMIKSIHSATQQKPKVHLINSTAAVNLVNSEKTTPKFISPKKQPSKQLHSSLDKLQTSSKKRKDEADKPRPKSAQTVENTLELVQLEINLYGQPIRNSPFVIKIKPQLAGGNSSKKNTTSNRYSYGSVFLNSKTPTEMERKRSATFLQDSSMMLYNSRKDSSFRTSPRPSQANRKPSSASASQNDGPCLRIGGKGHNKGEFMNLQGIAVHEDRIAVADSNGQCVQIFSMDGECLLKFGIKGRSPGQMQRPTSVTFTPDGQNILVSDYENKWVGMYNNDGKFVSRIGHGKLIGPKGVAIDKQGRVVIVDNKSSTVWLYTLSGKVLGKFGLKGIDGETSSPPVVKNSYAEAHAKMAGPHFCAIDPIDGDVVVTDFHNHKVKVFTSEGQYKFTFGSAGDGNGQFSAPTGVCIDNQGNILVADWGNSRVQIFDKNGSFLCFIDTSSDPLYGPQGLAMTKDNDIIVADSGNHCLKIYKQLL